MTKIARATDSVNMEELDIGLTSLDDYGAEHYGLGKEALFAMRKMEQTQKQIEKRFNNRCRKMEETQCKILEVRVCCPKRQRNVLISNHRL